MKDNDMQSAKEAYRIVRIELKNAQKECNEKYYQYKSMREESGNEYRRAKLNYEFACVKRDKCHDKVTIALNNLIKLIDEEIDGT